MPQPKAIPCRVRRRATDLSNGSSIWTVWIWQKALTNGDEKAGMNVFPQVASRLSPVNFLPVMGKVT